MSRVKLELGVLGQGAVWPRTCTLVRADAVERGLSPHFVTVAAASGRLRRGRARSLVMPRGSVVRLQGLTIEVRALTADGLIAAARFVFDTPLDDPRFCFLSWDGQGYRRFVPPAVGETVELPPASLHFSL